MPYTEDEKADDHFLFSACQKQVLNSPNKSTMIADLIKNCAQEKQKVEHFAVSHPDSVIHAE